VLYINAAEHYFMGKLQKYLTYEQISKNIETYHRLPYKPIYRYAWGLEMAEIEANDYNLNISRYVSTAEPEVQVDLDATHRTLVEIEREIRDATKRHNEYLAELGLKPLPAPTDRST
jgi:type I restriction enzyme M protein